MRTNGEYSQTQREISRIAASWKLRDILAFIAGAPRMVHTLLEINQRDVEYYEDQLRRRDADLQDIRGRRSVQLEAAARNGFQQGRDVEASRHAFPEGQAPTLNVEEAIAAASRAEPAVVTGELTLLGRSRQQ